MCDHTSVNPLDTHPFERGSLIPLSLNVGQLVTQFPTNRMR